MDREQLEDIDADKENLHLSIRQKRQIEKKIKRFEESTKHEYVIFGIKPLDYALLKWGKQLTPEGDSVIKNV